MNLVINPLVAYISRRLDEISIEEDIQIFEAWSRLSAEMVGYDLDSVEFFYNNDSGIDYYISSGRSFEFFQCKMHEPDENGELNIKKTFGPDGYEDLRNAALFLFGEITPTNIDPRLLGLREQLREEIDLVRSIDNEDDEKRLISIGFKLVTLGDNLSPAAKDRGRAVRQEFKRFEQNFPCKFSLEHTGLTTLAEFFESPEIGVRKANPISLHLAYDNLKFKNPNEAEIRSPKFVTFYTPAIDLVKASIKEGVALFDANVRYELSSSNINEEIRNSASHTKTMKLFHLYNNGVTITSSGWSHKQNQTVIELRDPAVINGCQTVRTLVKVRKELESEEDGHKLKYFDENCLVLVRLINKEIVNADDIVRAANTQNAMEPRNLLANRTEQLTLEKEMQQFSWFYERKDGALAALKESKRTIFNTPISKFQVRRERKGQKTIRSCDNREIARRWLSFIGYSDEGKNKKKQHFPADGKGLYAKIFLQTPKFHRGIFDIEKISLTGDVMAEGRPPVAWMLYSYHLFELIKHLLPIATRLRARVRKEIRLSGKVPTLAAINEAILNNDSTRLSFALSMLDHVVLELTGFAIDRALGDKWLKPGPITKVLNIGAIGEYHRFADFLNNLPKEGILDLGEELIREDPVLIAIRLAVQAIESTLKQPEFLSAFKSSERKSRYVESEQLVKAYSENGLWTLLSNFSAYEFVSGNCIG
jgi:hypothetical protein